MPQFDCVIVVDWSASGSPSPARPSADAIWIGLHGPDGAETQYHRTRAGAEQALVALIDQHRAQGRRCLVGCDFALAYPAGFARKITGTDDPAAIWAHLAQHITDGPANANNRFAVAASLNRRFGQMGPFWGRPATAEIADLPARKLADYTALGLPERRAAEHLVPSAQSVWKLFTTGSVGSQILMGLPMIHRLSQRPDTGVWPFGPARPVMLAEVYPSLLAPAVRDMGGIKDQAQVVLLSRALARADLAPMWQTPPIAQTEGWILGATHAPALLAAL